MFGPRAEVVAVWVVVIGGMLGFSGTVIPVGGTGPNAALHPAMAPPLLPDSYVLSFNESGLPSGANWSVSVNGTSQNSTNSSISFIEPNGTYAWALTPIPGYTTSWNGSAVVNGTNVTVNVPFSAVTYPVTFDETGLPGGSLWSVVLNYGYQETANSSLVFEEPNGTYDWTVGPEAGYTTQWSGTVAVDATNVTVAIPFSVQNYTVTFEEVGLPSATDWSVAIGGSAWSSAGATIALDEPNGTYSYALSTVNPVFAASSGTFVVNGSAILVPVDFGVVTYPVTTTETGLPAGSAWWVDGPVIAFESSTSNSLSFTAMNGTYTYSAVPGNGQYAATGGTFTVNGSAISVPVTFELVTYLVTFTAVGLPTGTGWSVSGPTLGTQASTNATLAFSEPNGTYEYTVTTVDSEFVGPVGALTVSGLAVDRTVSFQAYTFGITFTAAGLPSLTAWTVSGPVLGSQSSTAPILTFFEPNGTYSFRAATADGDYSSAGGSVTVAGSAVGETLAFVPVTFPVTFTSSGLPAGTAWWVNGTPLGSQNSTAGTLRFAEPNGTYAYAVASANKEYAASVGAITVNGSPLAPAIAFSLVTHAVTFSATGLRPGTKWSVTIRGQTYYSTGTSITVEVPNGTYTYTIGGLPGYSAARSQGVVTVNGGDAVQTLSFTASGAAPTWFGLPPTVGDALVAGLAVLVVAALLAIVRKRRGRKGASSPPTAPS